jgi:hypothetical protein
MYKININESDYDKRTCLHLACEEGFFEIVKYFIEELNANFNIKGSFYLKSR